MPTLIQYLTMNSIIIQFFSGLVYLMSSFPNFRICFVLDFTSRSRASSSLLPWISSQSLGDKGFRFPLRNMETSPSMVLTESVKISPLHQVNGTPEGKSQYGHPGGKGHFNFHSSRASASPRLPGKIRHGGFFRN